MAKFRIWVRKKVIRSLLIEYSGTFIVESESKREASEKAADMLRQYGGFNKAVDKWDQLEEVDYNVTDTCEHELVAVEKLGKRVDPITEQR